jgi:tetratricopeptide (TPR) repeat protein
MALSQLGEYQQARANLEESLARARKARDGNEIGFALWQLGHLAMVQGEYAQATPLLQEGLSSYRALRHLGGITFVLSDLGKAALLKGDHPLAVACYKEMLGIFWNSGNERDIAFSLEKLASVAIAQPQPERAARLLGAAEAIREAKSAAIYPYQVQDYETSLGALRPQLDEAAFAARWAEGRAMSKQQAVVYAMQAAA